jgi:hypothetical protein
MQEPGGAGGALACLGHDSHWSHESYESHLFAAHTEFQSLRSSHAPSASWLLDSGSWLLSLYS